MFIMQLMGTACSCLHITMLCKHYRLHKARMCTAGWGLCCQLRSSAQVRQQFQEWALVIMAGA